MEDEKKITGLNCPFFVAGDLPGDGEAVTKITKREDISLEYETLSSDDTMPRFGRMKCSVLTEGASKELNTDKVEMFHEDNASVEEKASFGRMKRLTESESIHKSEMEEFETPKESAFAKDDEGRKVGITYESKKNLYADKIIRYDAEEGGKVITEEKKEVSSKIYVIDFILRLIRKENIPLLIYLLMNILLISGIIKLLSEGHLSFLVCLSTGTLLYIASISIALSPIGEIILRHQTGCMKIRDRKTVDRLLPIFREVYIRAQKLYPNLSKDIRLYMCDGKSANAFATGRRTICMTKGLLELSDDEIKGVLGHEFGHLAHKDTDRILVIDVGNLFITAICLILQGIILFFQIMFTIFEGISSDNLSDAVIFGIILSLVKTFLFFIINSIMRVWTGIGCLLCMKTSRENEYIADRFSTRMGYGSYLCGFLEKSGDIDAKPHGLFANLSKSHPDSEDRIERMIDLMEGIE